jgi:hypothetical protein
MTNTRRSTLLLGAMLALAQTSCTNDANLLGKTTFNGNFLQIARQGRPIVIELYTPWADHDGILRSSPGADAGQLAADIGNFTTTFATRSAAISSYVENLFARSAPQPPATFPTAANVIVADLSQSTPATYLGVESGGKITSTGGINPNPTPSFGGRALTDDVMAITLQLTFGALVPQISGIPDDGKELDGRNGRPNLSNDFVTPMTAPKHYHLGPPYSTLQFPYLGDPR